MGMYGISIHALREEGDLGWENGEGFPHISIHALREEGDRSHRKGPRHRRISIHALREEGDRSTPGRSAAWESNFYPRPPRGGRPLFSVPQGEGIPISIHALREEGDPTWPRTFPRNISFLSTPSARRATRWAAAPLWSQRISIHALREEGDRGQGRIFLQIQISIHALREEGDLRSDYSGNPQIAISIHALREEGDCPPMAPPASCWYFYPRPPRGGRPLFSVPQGEGIPISIHALREEGDKQKQRKSR